MYKLPDITNETQLVQDWLAKEVKPNELAEQYGMNSGKVLGARVRRERKVPNLNITTKEEFNDILSQVEGRITLAHWLGLTPAKAIDLAFDLFMPEDELTRLFVDEGKSYKEITALSETPILNVNTITNKIKRMHLKHKPADKKRTHQEGIDEYYSNKERVEKRNQNMRNTMKEKYGVDSLSYMATDTYKESRLNWHETPYVHSASEALNLLEKDEKGIPNNLHAFLQNLKEKEGVSSFTVTRVSEIIGLPESTLRSYTGLRLHGDGNLISSTYRGRQEEITTYVHNICDVTTIDDSYPKFMDGMQLDIYVPYYNFAIEFNGTYWHANKGNYVSNPKATNYHAHKTELARKAGVNLMHIWEYDWENETKRNIIKSQIAYHLKKVTNRYYARKLSVKPVDNNTSRAFLTVNHIQGYTASKEQYGLYNGDELVSLMTFSKRRFDNQEGWELIRFANKLNTSVAGGASRLLKQFSNNHKGETLISYANNDFAFSDNNSLYNKLGFTYVKTTQSGYKWVNADNSKVILRYTVQPFKLKEFTAGTRKAPFEGATPDYSDNDTENTYMMRNGFFKIYDAGNDLYELHM